MVKEKMILWMLNGNSHVLNSKHIVSTDEKEAINEIFRKQLSTLREINNALEVKLKERVQRLDRRRNSNDESE